MEKRNILEYTQEEECVISSVEKINNKFKCNRCNNQMKDRFFQDDFGVYCLECITFNKSSTYTVIQRHKPIMNDIIPTSLNRIIYLSELQQIASRKCIEAYQRKRDIFIFAVCGAGKTEIIYDVLLKAVNEKKIVCITTPRKDVVLELLPRIRRDFKDLKVVGLYGGSEEKGQVGNVYISTTHQLINFYRYFDLIILDEVDAFPYYNNKMLEYFVKKSKRIDAPIIYLSATPTQRMKQLMSTKKLDYFIIPSRFHKQAIPLPKTILVYKLDNKLNKGLIPNKVMRWLEEKKVKNKQVFIFVPLIETGLLLETLLKSSFNCQFVCSESSNRREIIQLFRSGKILFLITTTILERGVTISGVDVCIIQANNRIFDERAIVQIVGRSGRDKNIPTSDVKLFTQSKTKAIKSAIKHIQYMNQKNEELKRAKK